MWAEQKIPYSSDNGVPFIWLGAYHYTLSIQGLISICLSPRVIITSGLHGYMYFMSLDKALTSFLLRLLRLNSCMVLMIATIRKTTGSALDPFCFGPATFGHFYSGVATLDIRKNGN
jgi:hypothetical protein